MVPPSMTLNDLWPRFQGHDIFDIEYLRNDVQEIDPDTSNDLDAPLSWFSRSRHFSSRISQKWCVLLTMLIKNIDRKPYIIYRMEPLSMTLSDHWPRFQGHVIFWSWSNIVKSCLEDKVTIEQWESIANIWNGAMFSDLDWPVNASRRFVSISWASCFHKGRNTSWCLSLVLCYYCFFAVIGGEWRHCEQGQQLLPLT